MQATINPGRSHGKPRGEITLDLLDNAETFLREAANHALQGSERSWVLAVVNLAIALELTLKAVLRSEHWTLLFDDVGKASKAALGKGQFKTVGFAEALRRCREIGGVGLETKDMKYLDDLNRLRNQALHYEFSRNVEQLRGLVARGLNIFNHLYSKKLKQGSRLPAEISAQLLKFDKYVAERMRRLRPQLKHKRRPAFRECLDCRQNALVVADGALRCLFCETQTTAKELARSSGECDAGPCPACDSGRLCLVVFNNDEAGEVCVLCGYRPPAGGRECMECGERFWDESGMVICQNCFGAKVGGVDD